MPQQKSFSVDELNHLRQLMTESELKRHLSHDLANDPALATVFNPPQVFSDQQNNQSSKTQNNQSKTQIKSDQNPISAKTEINASVIETSSHNGTTTVLMWANNNNNEINVSSKLIYDI